MWLQTVQRVTRAREIDSSVLEVRENAQYLLDMGLDDFADVRLDQFAGGATIMVNGIPMNSTPLTSATAIASS